MSSTEVVGEGWLAAESKRGEGGKEVAGEGVAVHSWSLRLA
jgi:hypothetical protein